MRSNQQFRKQSQPEATNPSKPRNRQQPENLADLACVKATWVHQQPFNGRNDLETLGSTFGALAQSSMKSFINETRKNGVDICDEYPTYRDDLAKNIIRNLGLVHPTRSSDLRTSKSSAAGSSRNVENVIDSTFKPCPKVSTPSKSHRRYLKANRRVRSRGRSTDAEEHEEANNITSDSFEDIEDARGVLAICGASTCTDLALVPFRSNVNTERALVPFRSNVNDERALVPFRSNVNDERALVPFGSNVDAERALVPVETVAHNFELHHFRENSFVPSDWHMLFLRDIALNICYDALDDHDNHIFKFANAKPARSRKGDGEVVLEDLKTFEGLKRAKINEEESKLFLKFIRPKNLIRVTSVDKPILKGLRMKLMTPPAPTWALRRCKAISVYTNLSAAPDRVIWGCASTFTHGMRKMQNSVKTHLPRDYVSDVNETVYTVSFYKPLATCSDLSKIPQPSQLPQLACKVQILGHQTLSDLRQQLYCSTDFLGEEKRYNKIQDVDSAVYSLPKNHRSKVVKSPCCFVIGDRVYQNNGVASGTVNYARLHKRHAWLNFRREDPFYGVNMNKARIDSLELKVGFPYVFIHNGICEHVIVFEDISMLKPKKSVVRASSYPKLISFRLKSKMCEVGSNQEVARYAVCRNPAIANHVTMMCQDCMITSCFIDGRKIPDVSIRPYFADPGRSHLDTL